MKQLDKKLGSPASFDVLGVLAFLIVIIVSVISINSVEKISNWYYYFLLVVGILGLAVDFVIVYKTFLRNLK